MVLDEEPELSDRTGQSFQIKDDLAARITPREVEFLVRPVEMRSNSVDRRETPQRVDDPRNRRAAILIVR